MEEESTQLPDSSINQLHHILQTDTFTFCLICLEDVHNTSYDVRKHLSSKNHGESVKRLFKACNPSLIDDIEDEKFVDLVSKLVLDISVLLEKETCYIFKKNDYWFCLICEQKVKKNYLFAGGAKYDIIDHVLSAGHVKKVKGVCFLYRLNANEDYLLLKKTVVICSVCKDVMQCQELDLLKTAIVHLQKKHPNYAKSHGFQWESSSLVENEEPKTKDDGGMLRDNPNIYNIPRSELTVKVEDDTGDEICNNSQSSVENIKNISSYNNVPIRKVSDDGGISDDYPNFRDRPKTEITVKVEDDTGDELDTNGQSWFEVINDISPHNAPTKKISNKQLKKKLKQCFKEGTMCICLFCKMRLRKVGPKNKSSLVAIENHLRTKHRKIYIETSLEDLFNNVTFINDPDKITLFSAEVRGIENEFKKEIKRSFKRKDILNYIFKTQTDYLCTICLNRISPCFAKDVVVLENFHNHFNSLTHQQCESDKMEASKALNVDSMNKEAIIELTVKKAKFMRKLGKTIYRGPLSRGKIRRPKEKKMCVDKKEDFHINQQVKMRKLDKLIKNNAQEPKKDY